LRTTTEEEETGGAGPLLWVGRGEGPGGAVPEKEIPFPAIADLVWDKANPGVPVRGENPVFPLEALAVIAEVEAPPQADGL